MVTLWNNFEGGANGTTVTTTNEVERVSPTGGVRKEKPFRWDLMSPRVMRYLSELLGRGAKKYEDRNWENGFDWSSSYNSAMNHMSDFWGGEDFDPETGMPHTVCAMAHMMFLTEFMTTHREFDDRPGSEKPEFPSQLEPTVYDRQVKYYISPTRFPWLTEHPGIFAPGDGLSEAESVKDLDKLDDHDLRMEAARQGFSFAGQVSRKALLSWLNPDYPNDAPFKVHIQQVARERAGAHDRTGQLRDLEGKISRQKEALAEQNKLRMEAQELAGKAQISNEALRGQRDGLRHEISVLVEGRDRVINDNNRLIQELEAAKRAATVAVQERAVAAENNDVAVSDLRRDNAALQQQIDRMYQAAGERRNTNRNLLAEIDKLKEAVKKAEEDGRQERLRAIACGEAMLELKAAG